MFEWLWLWRRLDRIERLLILILKKEYDMSQEMDDLKAAVANEGTAVQSAIVLLNGLSAQIAATAGDPAAAAALAADVNTQAAALAAAVAANTPAAPAPTPAP